MELEDSALPFLQGLVATTSAKVAFADVDYALLVGGFPRKPVRSRHYRIHVFYVVQSLLQNVGGEREENPVLTWPRRPSLVCAGSG